MKKTLKRSKNMTGSAGCFLTGLMQEENIKRLTLERPLSNAPIKSKTDFIRLGAEQERSLETLFETANLYGQGAAKIVVNDDGSTDITTITPSQWMSDGCATDATDNGTEKTDQD